MKRNSESDKAMYCMCALPKYRREYDDDNKKEQQQHEKEGTHMIMCAAIALVAVAEGQDDWIKILIWYNEKPSEYIWWFYFSKI